jgi:nucleoside-diphosphate-sugar epimerase
MAGPDPRAQRVLILGGSGFVGPSLIQVLLSEGHGVTVLNRGIRPIPGTTQLVADRNHTSDMQLVGERVSAFDILIDLSCYNRAQATLAWRTFAHKCAQWIHLSSAAVYCSPPSIVPREYAPIGGAPIWGDYGRGKSEADQYLLSARGGPALVILRPPYLYGPGNDNDRETFVWSRALRKRPVLVPGDGQTPIQFLHTEDLARAVVRVIRTPPSARVVYNIAAPEEVTLKDFVTRLGAICGMPDPAVVVGTSDYGFAPRQYFPFRDHPTRVDARTIREALGWTPQFTFESGFTATFHSLDPIFLRQRPLDLTVEYQIRNRLAACGSNSQSNAREDSGP